VLAEELYWFPVRHHSPAVAKHLEAAILDRRPKLIFLEGPSECSELIPFIVDAKTKPPVAIYSSFRDDQNVLGIPRPAPDIPARLSSFYPLMPYSPEYVAMVSAKKTGAEVVFMDLPHFALAQLEPPKPRDGKEPDAAPESPQFDREWDQIFVESSFYKQLAAAAGYRNWPEAWDSMFEIRSVASYEEFRRELASFCCAVRATSPRLRIEHDGTLERERFMMQTIRNTLKQRRLKPRDAMVVCGGFHLFLNGDDPIPSPEIPQGTVYTSIVPYSFFLVSELSGYGAGNRAPQYYQTAWEYERGGQRDELLVHHVISVLKQARKAGEVPSSADAIAICQHARMLAGLRGRATPILDDIHDALITCCCKGKPDDEGAFLLKAIDDADIGTKIGKVTPSLGRLPLVNDFYTQLSDLELGELLGKEKKLSLDLDKRDVNGARRSALLHRLRFLEIPIGALVEKPKDHTSGRIFHEKWMLKWSPQVEPALVEQNLFGDSVESAVLAKLHVELAKEELQAGKTCARLVQTIDMDLPNLVAEVEEKCGRAVDADQRFVSLCHALAQLSILERYAVYRDLRADTIVDLITRCYDRACFALADVVAAPEEQQAEVLSALLSLAEIVQSRGERELDRNLFVQHLQQAAAATSVPFLRGAFLGLLAEMRVITANDLAAEVANLALASPERMVTAGEFVDGIFAVSRTSIMLGADALIAAIDDLLRAASWDHFLIMLPKLRGACERLHERQRDSLAERVAVRYGLAKAESIRELTVSVAAATLLTRIDQQVADIMKPWEF
jgi:Family of unknown function (DUF5682)